ncbi:MAG: HAD family phosphatase [Ruminiclostridium sp.]|nr:HAD family phosphatase [Ruminiclostridium sp.]
MSIDLTAPVIKGAIFDLDGTLFDSMGFWSHLDERFLKKHGVFPVPQDYMLEIAHLGAVETAVYTKKRFGFTMEVEEMMQEWHEDAVGYYRDEVTMKPGAEEYLRKLKNAGIKLAVATANSRDLYMPAVLRLGLDGVFSAYAEVDEVGRKKGFPDIYELAAQRLGVKPAECAVFEDIYVALMGAKAGGFITVGVYDETSERDKELIKGSADAFVDSFGLLL